MPWTRAQRYCGLFVLEAEALTLGRLGGERSRDVCDTWRNPQVGPTRMRPYIQGCAMIAGVSPDESCEELDRLCAAEDAYDVAVYGALQSWIQQHREPSKADLEPLGSERNSVQADEIEAMLPEQRPEPTRILDYGCGRGAALAALHARGYAAEDLHCIELYDMVREEDRGKFTLHVLQDPVKDLQSLAKGPLRGYFHGSGSFDVFHHIEPPETRDNALRSIFAMLRPGAFFLLNDWNTEGDAALASWYDVAHLMLWLFMGSPAAQSEPALDIGTAYFGVEEWIRLAERVGFRAEDAGSYATDNPIGGFSQIFRRPQEGLAGILPFSFHSHHNETHAERRVNSARLSVEPGAQQPSSVHWRPEPRFPFL